MAKSLAVFCFGGICTVDSSISKLFMRKEL